MSSEIDVRGLSMAELKNLSKTLGVGDDETPKFKSKTWEGLKYLGKSITGVAKEVAPIADTLGGAVMTAGGAMIRVYTEPALEKAGEVAGNVSDRLTLMATKRELAKELKRRELVDKIEAAAARTRNPKADKSE